MIVISLITFSIPVFAFAQTSTLLMSSGEASLTIMPLFFGTAPMFTMFTVDNPSGTESIDFGDGYTSGTNGCSKNSQGWCDFSQPVWHTYQYPGSYTVTLYAHYAPKTYQILGTTTVTVRAGLANVIPF